MGYSPSPRPTFSEPTHIRYADVTRHLWGDPVAGEVSDWIYASTDKIHQLLFGLAPGGAFRHSDSARTIFAADEVLYVISGVMVLVNPQTGEVHPVRKGEAAFFRRDTWHHAFNHSSEPLLVVEYFAPPPSQGTSGRYAQTKPNLTAPLYAQDHLLGQWPMQQAQIRSGDSIRVLRRQDTLWRLEGAQQQMLVGIQAATEHLTTGTIELLPGQKSDLHVHGGDECLYLLDGTLNVYAPEKDGQKWFELEPRDGFYVPHGAPHQYWNMSDRPVTFIFGVAPHYLPEQA